VYLEATSVSNKSLNGHVHHVKHYYNKRFYKYTEESGNHLPEIPSYVQNIDPNTLAHTKTLYGSEGCMLPSVSELKLAEKGKFDIYTVTNLSFMDIALHLGIHPNLYAVAKNDLANREEPVLAFKDFGVFTTGGKAHIDHAVSA
jgi:hypothetical protein